jgi:hypothetical protein
MKPTPAPTPQPTSAPVCAGSFYCSTSAKVITVDAAAEEPRSNSDGVDEISSCLGCGLNGPTTTKGVWYKFTGAGNDVFATTCFSETNFDTQLHVFSQCGYVNPTCVASNDDDASCSNSQSKVTWTAVDRQEYFIFVSGFGGREGIFRFDLEAA